MPAYRVTTYITVEADDPKEAALKAFVLHEEMTPEEFEVSAADDTDAIVEEITLDQDDKDLARELQRAGKLFRTTNLKD